MGHSNPTYVGAENIQSKDPFHIEICEFQKCGLGFGNMNDLSHDDAQGICEHDYQRLDFNQSEV